MERVKIVFAPKSFSTMLPTVKEMLKDYDVEYVVNTTDQPFTKEETIKYCADADAIMSEIEILDEEVLSHCKKLKCIAKFGSGTDNIDTAYAKEHGIEVRRAAFTNNESVAEMAISLMFIMMRGLYPAINSVKNGQWNRLLGNEILGKTAGVIGMGAIGREVIRMCHGLGMNIIANDPFYDDEKFMEKYAVNKMERDEVLKNADIIFLHTPLLPETEGLINDETLKMMKSTAYLINTSRGGLIDEEALYRALKDGVIAGAGVDVFSKEPPDEHPLLGLENFVLAPHTAAYTKEAIDRCVKVSTKNLIEMLFDSQN